MRTLSNWPLRAKLLVVLALPTIAAVLLAVVQVYNAAVNTSVYHHAVERVELHQTMATAIDDVQAERAAMSSWIVSGRPAERGALDNAIAKADASSRAVEGAGSAVEDIDSPQLTALYDQAKTRIGVLGQVRSNAVNTDFTSDAAFNSYGVIINSLLGVTDDTDISVTDRGVSDRQEALSALAHAKEDSAEQNVYLTNAAIRNSFEPAELEGITNAGANLVSSIATFDTHANANDQRTYSNTMVGPEISDQFQLQQLALQRGQAKLPVSTNATEVGNNANASIGKYRTVEKTLLGNAKTYAEGILGSARTALIITSVVLVLGLAIALGLMFFVGRMMLRQLRTLRGTALQVANEQLPQALDRIMSSPDPRAASQGAIDPVPVATTEEIGQVARAFDEVHGQAIRLATEQALLRDNLNGILVNLSRRSQVLVQRQLSVIDRLEEHEQEPDRLSDLFELDHLTTRLRRNGESLLVLSGSGPANTVSRPTRAADIIGAAVSETEEYVRVDVGSIPDVSVHGQAVHDLVHLLAELLDNATFFSERSTMVQVRAAMTRTEGLGIQITDRGVGMTDEQLDSANRNLMNPPDLDVSVTRRMGLYVVARLGKRHGIRVRLRENEDIDGGVVARVEVPVSLLIDQAKASATLPPQVSVKQIPAGTRTRTNSDAFALPEPRQTMAAEDDTIIMPLMSAGREREAPPVPEVEREESAPAAAQSVELPELEQPLSLDSLMQSGEAAAMYRERQAPNGSSPEVSANKVNGLLSRSPVPRAKQEPSNGKPAQFEPYESHRYSTNRDQERHDELIRKGTPIYQEMMSHWLTEAPEEASANGADADWGSSTDQGWDAASLLNQSHGEKITDAGLPKRVPNAYLVPGSMNAAEEHGVQEKPGGGTDLLNDDDAAQSAVAARAKMARFQRGFMAGRHALAEPESRHAILEPTDATREFLMPTIDQDLAEAATEHDSTAFRSDTDDHYGSDTTAVNADADSTDKE